MFSGLNRRSVEWRGLGQPGSTVEPLEPERRRPVHSWVQEKGYELCGQGRGLSVCLWDLQGS